MAPGQAAGLEPAIEAVRVEVTEPVAAADAPLYGNPSLAKSLSTLPEGEHCLLQLWLAVEGNSIVPSMRNKHNSLDGIVCGQTQFEVCTADMVAALRAQSAACDTESDTSETPLTGDTEPSDQASSWAIQLLLADDKLFFHMLFGLTVKPSNDVQAIKRTRLACQISSAVPTSLARIDWSGAECSVTPQVPAGSQHHSAPSTSGGRS